MEKVKTKGTPTTTPKVENVANLLVIGAKQQKEDAAPIVEVNKPLNLRSIPDNIVIEINDVMFVEAEEKRTALLGYLRSNVLRAFDCIEVGKTAVQTGRMYFNGNATKLKMPKVKVLSNGRYGETPKEYAKRTLGVMNAWLIKSQQNAFITVKEVEELFNELEEQSLEETTTAVAEVVA